ncbi:PREDICTED: maspardin-like isoform X2 [Populus euphratica]|uniref:Maspardin-like isoform X2 n=1 Tax=Populus euphratica TaxID=75702 RepID=A0AAJ6UQ76_POPEU|nr:PREDICTED: maspardin-like isoform X2 [Populus euphratica]
MKGVFSAPGDYIHFKSQVPLHKIPIGTKQWRYYDFGPKAVPPLICLPGIAGTADVYYKQIMSLSMKIHLYGTSLGGFLAQLFAQHRPRRVRSLILSNTFLKTCSFASAMPWAPVVSWTPSFLLKRYVLTGIRDGPHEPFIADSVDFVVSQVETLSRDDLASRLTLNVDAASVGSLLLSDSCITIMDTNDYCAIPQQLKDQLSDRYPEARCAHLKSGGDFPFLSRPDEVNLHLQLHLRRVGLEAQPDMVRGIPKDGAGGSHGEEKDGKEGPDDEPKDDEGSSEGQSKENQLCPAPESSASHTSHDQLLSNAQLCLIAPGDTIHLCFFRKQHVIAIEIFLQYTLEIFLRLASLSREDGVHHFIFWAKTQMNGVK